MSNQHVVKLLAKTIREEDGFIIRAAKCVGIHMEHSNSFESEVSFKMRTVTKSEDGEFDTTGLMVKTDAFEYLDVLFEVFVDNAYPFHDHGEDDLRYLYSIYEREKEKGVGVGYVEVTFFLNGDFSEVKLKTAEDLVMTVGNMTWKGPLFATK